MQNEEKQLLLNGNLMKPIGIICFETQIDLIALTMFGIVCM